MFIFKANLLLERKVQVITQLSAWEPVTCVCVTESLIVTCSSICISLSSLIIIEVVFCLLILGVNLWTLWFLSVVRCDILRSGKNLTFDLVMCTLGLNKAKYPSRPDVIWLNCLFYKTSGHLVDIAVVLTYCGDWSLSPYSDSLTEIILSAEQCAVEGCAD